MDYQEEKRLNRQRLLDLGSSLAAGLLQLDYVGSGWATRGEEDHEYVVYLDRADGLRIAIYWHAYERRPEVRPVVPQIRGRYGDKSALVARFDPKRDPLVLAKDVLRRVVRPWEQELTALGVKQRATLSQRALLLGRAASVARSLGTSLREDAEQHVEQYGELAFGIGTFKDVDVDVSVSGYRDRVTFKIQIEDDYAFAEELAHLLRRRVAP